MRHTHRVDGNQSDIVAALRKAGCSVQSLTSIGNGCPDLLVGKGDKNYLIEVKLKDGSLTWDQRQWHAAWNGEVIVATTPEIALRRIWP